MGSEEYSLSPRQRAPALSSPGAPASVATVSAAAKEAHSGWKIGGMVAGALMVFGGALVRYEATIVRFADLEKRLSPVAAEAAEAKAKLARYEREREQTQDALSDLYLRLVLAHADLEATALCRSNERAHCIGEARWFFEQAFARARRAAGASLQQAYETAVHERWSPR